jgi:hypothetical protein
VKSAGISTPRYRQLWYNYEMSRLQRGDGRIMPAYRRLQSTAHKSIVQLKYLNAFINKYDLIHTIKYRREA